MTRGSIPQFDLYDELEVSRQATAEVIEAAYRALAKRHHPDVSTSGDGDRITRLNIARDWLLDPARRARYDRRPAVDGAPARRPAPRERRTAAPDAAKPARPSSAASFGVHSREVRRFLAELRELDSARAATILQATTAIDADRYTAARDASLGASRAARNAEWGFARDAASIIVKGKVPDAAAAGSLASVAADFAGAIVARDLMPEAQFEILREPWARGASDVPIAPVRGQRQERAVGAPLATAGLRSVSRDRRTVALAAAGLALVVAVAAFINLRKPESAVAGLTTAPSNGALVAGGQSAPVSNAPLLSDGSIDPVATLVALETTSVAPAGQPTGALPGQTRPPAAATTPPTPRITDAPTPRPSPPPTPRPTPPPSPTAAPTPSPSPRALCTVVDLVGLRTTQAQQRWTNAGFTGTVLFSPQPPPKYTIGSQSLVAGSDAPCASDITVGPAAP